MDIAVISILMYAHPLLRAVSWVDTDVYPLDYHGVTPLPLLLVAFMATSPPPYRNPLRFPLPDLPPFHFLSRGENPLQVSWLHP